MRRPAVPMILTSLLLSLGAVAHAQSMANLVHASLLADVSTVKPGEPFTIGVLLKIRPGWHVYWLNPGDAGLPTRVQWTLPAGYTASPLRFPVPEHLDQPGGIVCFGYTDEVLLTSTITPPTTAESTQFSIGAKVSWLCCKEDCVPGKASLELRLSFGDKTIPDNTALVKQWQNRMPTRATAPTAALKLSDASPQTQILTTRRITDPRAIIPGAVDGLLLTVGMPQTTETGTTIPISAKMLKGQTITAASVPILVTWANPDGSARLGEEITVPITIGN